MAKTRTRKAVPEAITQDDDFNRTLSEMEDEWLAARLRGEAESTDRLLDENYHGGNSDGLGQTKADFVGFVQTSRGPYTHGDHTERNIRLYGDTAVSTGVVTLRSADSESRFRYLRVFSKRAGEWRLVASQSTRIRTA